MDDLLQQGITAYKAGKREEARKIFITVVKQNPDSEQAWGWMNNVCDTDKEHIYCLNQLLHVNPNNEKAHHLLDQLLGSPLYSTPSNPQTSPSSDVKARRKNSSFTQTQIFILLGLVVTIFLLFGVAILYLFIEKEPFVVVPSPTSFVTSSANVSVLPTQVLPTATLVPTYVYAPTWTPLPSPTSFVVPTLVPPTSIPQQAQSNPAPANPPAGNSTSNCSAQLDYASAMHKYYLDQIDYIHAPLMSLYQSWIDEAARNRDALGMVEAQRKLDNEQAQVKAEKSTENKRYKAEQASVNASCQ